MPMEPNCGRCSRMEEGPPGSPFHEFAVDVRSPEAPDEDRGLFHHDSRRGRSGHVGLRPKSVRHHFAHRRVHTIDTAWLAVEPNAVSPRIGGLRAGPGYPRALDRLSMDATWRRWHLSDAAGWIGRSRTHPGRRFQLLSSRLVAGRRPDRLRRRN